MKFLADNYLNSPLRGGDVSGNPLNKVSGVLGLDRLNLVFNLLHRNLASIIACDGEVSLIKPN